VSWELSKDTDRRVVLAHTHVLLSGSPGREVHDFFTFDSRFPLSREIAATTSLALKTPELTVTLRVVGKPEVKVLSPGKRANRASEIELKTTCPVIRLIGTWLHWSHDSFGVADHLPRIIGSANR
jgi:hypothetical protein